MRRTAKGRSGKVRDRLCRCGQRAREVDVRVAEGGEWKRTPLGQVKGAHTNGVDGGGQGPTRWATPIGICRRGWGGLANVESENG